MPVENPIAAAGHQGFSANLYTLTSDLFPSRAVAVVGIGGMVDWGNADRYMIPFFIAASAYLIVLLLIHTLSPRLEPAVVAQG